MEEDEVDQNGPHFKNEYLFSTTINRLIAPHFFRICVECNKLYKFFASCKWVLYYRNDDILSFNKSVGRTTLRLSKTVMKFANREIM